MWTKRSESWIRALVSIGAFVGWASTAAALTPIASADFSSDVTVELDATTFFHEDVAVDDLVTTTPAALGALPAAGDVDAYHLQGDGDQLLSFDITVELPGPVIAGPEDVVAYDGVGYAIVFDGSAEGLPPGVQVDALTEDANLVLSFDTTVELDGTTYTDEDLVEFDGASFSMHFDGSVEGVDTALDLDAAHALANGNLVVSFDGSGSVGGVDFDDEDVLEFDGVTWEMAYDGSVEHAALPAADLDAVHFVPEPGQLLSFAAGVAFLLGAPRRRASPRG